ncbi:hypothetical protein Tco_0702996 [Tanacetum coccineum]|uniref:Uncharacterized protein n=1 Tax=Tanacetum coccineum TaxID=301880 RepID=A0ABQ4XXL4_9ASTR
MAEYSQKWHNGTSRVRSTETSDGLAAIQAQLNNLGREIKKERGFGSLLSSTEANPRDQVKSISTTIEVDSKSDTSYWKLYAVLDPPNTPAKIDVYTRKITLRVGEERIVFTSVKPASSFNKEGLHANLKKEWNLNYIAEAYGRAFGRNQGDDLMPIIEEGEVIEEFKTRDDELKVGIDDYHKPFVKRSCIKTRRFPKVMNIPFYNGDNDVTYQMVRSQARFEHHTNEQCNKISPLLKVSEENKMNGISHPYQKLTGFYKGVLNLGPVYIRDAKKKREGRKIVGSKEVYTEGITWKDRLFVDTLQKSTM